MSQHSFNWQEEVVIVTGGGGFLGRHVVANLEAVGTNVIVPRKTDYDLREKDDVIRLYAQYKDATMIIHLAATVGGIGINREHPGTFFYDNLMMGVLLMEHARQMGIHKFVGVGTICEYPKYTSVPFKEDDLWSGYPEETNAPYGLAKKMLLVQAQAYRQEFGFNAIHLLPVNLYGPGDNFDPKSAHVIPDILRKMEDARINGVGHVDLFGDGTPTREFLYVEDAAEAIVLAAANYNSSEPMNIGSAFEISIKDLAETIADVVGFKGELRWDTSKPNGQPRRKLDVSRAEQELGWHSKVDFMEGLQKTLTWYREYRAEQQGLSH